MFDFGGKKSPLLGIDIGSTSVKLVELSQISGGGNGAGQIQVERLGVEVLPANAMNEKKIAEPEMVGQTIRRLLSRTGTPLKRAAVAVSGSIAITKTIPMPATIADSELESQIELEAEQYIPFPLEEVNFDFNVLGPSQNNPKTVDVLLAASRSENIDDRIAALQIAGLVPKIIDIESYAIEKACSLLFEPADYSMIKSKVVGIVDIGSVTTTLHVLHQDQIIYSREQNFGGQHLREEVQRRYNISREMAIDSIASKNLPEDYEINVFRPFCEALSQQVARALQFFYSGTNFNHVDQIILAGGTAAAREVEVAVENRIKVPVIVANPFFNLCLSSKIDSTLLQRIAPSMMVATGLALRGFS